MFRVVRLSLCGDGEVLSRCTHPALFESRDEAMAVARQGAEGLLGDFAYDARRQCWSGTDRRNARFRFVVEEVAVEVAVSD